MQTWQLAPECPHALLAVPNLHRLSLPQHPVLHEVELHTHDPPTQAWPVAHAFPHAPQLLASVFKLMLQPLVPLVPLQLSKPVLHVPPQTPDEQVAVMLWLSHALHKPSLIPLIPHPLSCAFWSAVWLLYGTQVPLGPRLVQHPIVPHELGSASHTHLPAYVELVELMQRCPASHIEPDWVTLPVSVMPFTNPALCEPLWQIPLPAAAPSAVIRRLAEASL